MKKNCLGLVLVLILASCSSNDHKPESPEDNQSGQLKVTRLQARPVALGANSAAYFTILNRTADADTLMSIEAESFDRAELHESYTTEEGLSGMRQVGPKPIAAGDSLVLEPGGYHIMMMKAESTFTEGDSLSLRLFFSASGPKEILIPVTNF